jgi:uncharacterized iron-regulated membrane protein
MNRWTRQCHRWGSILIAVPLLIVIATGIVLQVKKQVEWVQPPTKRGSATVPSIGWEQMLAALRQVPEAEIADWPDIDRLDVRVDRGLVKVKAKNSWEVQLDLATAEVLHVAYRRSDLIEQLHDGSWFGGDTVKLAVFLPSAIVLLGLWLTGIYLFALPIIKKRQNRRARQTRAQQSRMMS